MRVRAETINPASVKADVLAVPIYLADRELPPDLAELDAATGGAISRALDWGEFNPVEDETGLIEVEGINAGRILFVASGRRGRGAWRARRSASKAARRLQGRGATSLAFWLRDGEGADAYAAAAIGASQGTFRPYAYYGRVRDTDAMLRSVEELILVGQEAPAEAVLSDAMAIAEGVEWARELSNRSANDLYPERMAELARGLVDDGCTVEILGPSEMEALGMGALLGVGMGAAHEPRLIAVKLPGWEAGGDKRLAIVGKGVCFDSGGISLKPPERMEEMKHDKAGAAAVLAAVRTVARLAPQTPLMAVMPMVENMPGAAAQRPGDVVKTMNGKTIEVINTDAEGRLILADALHWAEKQGATHIVDVATLTGAASIAFGDLISAYFARPREFGSQVAAAAEATGEWFWEMPLATEYRDTLDSAHADMVNSASREASLIKSAVFLSEFVTVPWVHVDIGGSAYLIRDKAHNPKGSLGTTVSTLVRLARDFAAA
ncbi:MAG TPA: M17 family peptidase N-terminal domain-containing protein [Candidatus Limnocylindria bacterium]|nr:M17 family peptidase N-terminal domain-containing protein [Candidatus Limnocylindria bacterium]